MQSGIKRIGWLGGWLVHDPPPIPSPYQSAYTRRMPSLVNIATILFTSQASGTSRQEASHTSPPIFSTFQKSHVHMAQPFRLPRRRPMRARPGSSPPGGRSGTNPRVEKNDIRPGSPAPHGIRRRSLNWTIVLACSSCVFWALSAVLGSLRGHEGPFWSVASRTRSIEWPF